MNSSNKITTMLQFAYCARKLTFGESNIVKMLNKQIKVLVLAEDISSSQEKKYLSKAEYYQVDVVRYLTKKELGALFDKNEVACVGISDFNLAQEIKRLSE